ncbi:hypothetical protein GCM10027403_17300 [Arthrobacter tecti]
MNTHHSSKTASDSNVKKHLKNAALLIVGIVIAYAVVTLFS